MLTATKKKLGVATAAIVLTGALVGASATAANAYGLHSIVIGISQVAPKASAPVTVTARYIKPGTKLTVTVAGHSYTTTASSSATASIKFKAPKLAGKYTVTIANVEKTVKTSITVGTITKAISEKTTSAKVGKTFKITGALTSTIKSAKKTGATVVISYKVGKKSYKYTVHTFGKGTYTKSVKITKKGTYTVKVSVLHTATFTAASKTVHIKVK